MNYEKTALSYIEILQQLKSRGLNFQNESLALQELKSISYFRIASYLKYYESNTNDHRYKEGSFYEDAKLNQLLTKYNKINLYSMGFPSKWREEDLWKN
jgi:abortive infection bacteriophage resistance protein